MGDYSSPPAGYVLRRNGTCTETEQTCDHPWASWYNCCPEGSYCSDDRMICCQTKSGCAALVKEDPHCANNATWDLYYNGGSYFCCLHGKQGFVETFPGNGGAGIGCADGELDNASQSLLQVIATGTGSASPSPSVSATPTQTSTDSPLPSISEPDSSSSGNAGTIAGSVVGGCAGLALIMALLWFLIRRRRKQVVATSNLNTPAEDYKGLYRAELANNPVRSELSGSTNNMAHELPVNTS
ncbi:hypothetical protein ASPVEDRAFT_64819 [Aspergillus versicolor CBS 583.65]|uniref:Mid2 domain-containing protein n=1 Tax=Aspergillus versicolor CBS 583.65 TaxID=1036611 RepID=A0A1L9PWY8_ASPVE|nr:uncharacterized protein ASPVEDRAFT_64819 [Aspergillus versicolor CBS 583.65]OJJ05952.1 hypothetical protein ASPVEDRAFT_64819 [Aspergillus versicolor CBS 583.65]